MTDPYPLYKRIRDIHPVCWDDRMGERGAWMVTGYTAAHDILRDPRYSAQRTYRALDGPAAAILRTMHMGLFGLDPPDHTRVRRHLAWPFMPQAVADLRERIETTAHRLLDESLDSGKGEMDVMASYAFPLPALTMAGIFGLPADAWHRYFNWILDWGLLIDDGPLAAEHYDRYVEAVGKYRNYFREILSRPGAGSAGLLGTLRDRHVEGQFADEEELIGNLILLLNAGLITTAHQIGNTLLHLLSTPALYQRLRAEPAMTAAATPEFLRYDCSVQLTKRQVREPLELYGQKLDRGDEVFVWLGAANHDPAQFRDPDRLDLDRGPVRHLAFSHGIHYCLGAQLGQLTNEIAIKTFVERVPEAGVNLDGMLRSTTATFRGPHLLPITVEQESP